MSGILSETLKEFIPKHGEYKYLVNGIWEISKSQETLEVHSPIDDSLVGKLQAITKAEANAAVQNAEYSFPSWRDETVDKRAEILCNAAKIMEENVDILTHLLSWEIGKTYEDAHDEVLRTAKLIQYYAEEGRRVHNESLYSDSFPGYSNKKTAITKRVPLGVVLAISPFNYPINEGAPKIVGALIAGNTVVFKPSLQGAISALYMVECFRLAGLPAGVLNVVTGKSSEIGDELVSNKYIKAINFTGSTQTAQRIRDKMGIIPFIAGLSGKDAAIVLNDADIDAAVSEIAKGAFGYSGQRCTGIKRVILQTGIRKEFTEQFVAYVHEHFTLGDPREKSVTQGPVINMAVVKYLDELVEDALKKGANRILGEDNKGYQNRLFYPATILDDVKESMRVAWEEPFGPILPLLHVETIDGAIALANKSEFGLQSSVFTRDINNAFYIAEKLDVGTIQINGKDSRGPDHFPFLGVKGSGIGQVQGAKYLIESMTRIKTIVINKNF